MSEKPKSKYNYQATVEVVIRNIRICVNGVGDTQKAATELFDHALKSILEIIKAGEMSDDESNPILR